jgi:hypothetical protein
VRFIYLERQKLPDEILKHNVEEKRQFLIEINLDTERNDAEVQVYADGLVRPPCSFLVYLRLI